MRAIGLSLVVCTFNRARLLTDLLESIERELTDRLDLEVVVVDNNSTDGTRDVVVSFRHRLPNLTYVFEGEQGLSAARNRGIRSSTKEYILYIDDDATLSEGFLMRAEVVLRRFEPDLFGGPVLPRFDGPVPEWFDRNSEIRQFERFSGFSKNGSVSGGNFGVKRSVVDRIGTFDTSLGMKGDRQGFGEDRELVERYRSRMSTSEQKIYYAVELPVIHYTAPYKFDRVYQYNRKFHNAAAQAQTYIKSGRHSLRRSLLFAGAHVVLFPMRAILIGGRLCWTPSARHAIVGEGYGIAGRAYGTLQMTARLLIFSGRKAFRLTRRLIS